ncbi:MAG: radical SAM/SPASM domain-containing protein [Pseudobdellovibrio sp.]
MFERVYLEISNICNLQCNFCPEVVRDKKIISPEDFKNFANQVKPLTKQICLHLMGEPLGHPQFKEIVQICDELNLKIFLTTNGTLIQRHAETILSWKGLEQINFSVHSYFANTQRQTLDQYLKPIISFCRQSVDLNNQYYINLRLWNLESPQAQKQQNYPVIQAVENEFDVKINDNVDIKLHKSKKIMHKLYLHFDTEFEWPTLKRDVISQKGTCYGLRKQLAVHANGDVVPCCLDKEAILKLGSLHNNNIKEILSSDKAKKIRTSFEQGQLIEELCQKCQYVERFQGKI